MAERAAGDDIPAVCAVIEVRVAELAQLFNAIDPAPFREKDLDPGAEEFIVGAARDLPRDVPLALRVHLDRAPDLAEASAILRDAVREYFRHRADAARQQLRQLFRTGRTTLVIGLFVLGAAISVGQLIEIALPEQRLGEILREGFVIGGWVAMWRPMEIFFYEWWPIRAEARLFDRLSAMPVRVAASSTATAP